MSNHCNALYSTLSTGDENEIDEKEQALEISNLPSLPSGDMTPLELLSFIHKKQLKELYPNLRKGLHSPCDLGLSREELFKVKAHKDLAEGIDGITSGLVIISINQEIGTQLSYEDISTILRLKNPGSRSCADDEDMRLGSSPHSASEEIPASTW